MNILHCQGKVFGFHFAGSGQPLQNSEHEGEVISSVVWKYEHGRVSECRGTPGIVSCLEMRKHKWDICSVPKTVHFLRGFGYSLDICM